MLTAFDVGVGILVLISAILATARGLTREVLSLATWAGSAAIAVYMWLYQPQIARGLHRRSERRGRRDRRRHLHRRADRPPPHHHADRRLRRSTAASARSTARSASSSASLRGILIAIVVVIFGTWLLGASAEQLRGPADWARESKSLPVLDNWGRSLIAVLPDDLEEQVTEILQGRDGETEGAAEPAAEGTDEGEDATPPGGDAPPVEDAGGSKSRPGAGLTALNSGRTAN